MRDNQLHRARIVSSVAATAISLACGTNYAYSAWAPQFADKLHLSATQSNLIGLFGNLGMYSLGVPAGILVDTKGSRPAVIIGSMLLGIGYFPFRAAYDTASGSVSLMCFFSFLTGFGGCMAFAGSVKTSALNWPHHRGTATAFPLAAFGLSAFFFSFVGSLLSGDTGAFLMLLAAGTFGVTFVGAFFLRVVPNTTYHPVASEPGIFGSQQLRRTSSQDAKTRPGRPDPNIEPGMSPTKYTNPTTSSSSSSSQGGGGTAAGPATPGLPHTPNGGGANADLEAGLSPPPSPPPQPKKDDDDDDDEPDNETDETSSLVSKASSMVGDVLVQNSVDMDRSHRVDIRGWRLLSSFDFWQLFSIMGVLAGIGLMTINNIGHDANALWKHYDDTVSEDFLIKRQQMHVSILSVASFLGRLLSGVGSDFLVKVLRASRIWCLVVASCIFCIGQTAALTITNPQHLWLVSSLSGLGYGFLFGVFPSIVAETFGIHGLSQNWGFMTLSPVISGAIFNQFYGLIFDQHSIVGPEGHRTCPDGLGCYWAAYMVTLASGGLGLVVTLLTIKRQHRQRLEEEGKGAAED